MRHRFLVALACSAVAPSFAGEDQPPEKSARKPNRLAGEKSPYLQQHAYNPVDWYPWGDEAFEKATREQKPVFLSIGYSTCHWCHVMERESFEDEEIAKLLNEHFVSIKVDREERPDVDGVYMDFVQRVTGHGGWPLSAFLTPGRKPFHGGTYYPPKNFLALLERVRDVWRDERERLVEHADGVAQRLSASASRDQEEADLDASACAEVFRYLDDAHDETHGGFGGAPRYAPKFPRTSNLDFLLRYARRTGSERAARIAYRTLDRMLAGGIRDHLGGGFHRYSTDRVWLLPHFEKMLYDNALIARTLLDAYRSSNEPRYLEVARETLDYVMARLSDPAGGFRSAEDADADGVEGLTYVWSKKEVLDILGEKDGELFCELYGVKEEGNFEEERPDSRSPAHQNVLHVAIDGGEEGLAGKHGVDPANLRERLAAARAKLLAARARKPQPFLDSKVLVEWNGLAISAFAHGYQVTGERCYLEAAQKAADFIATKMVVGGKLTRRYKDGDVKVPAFLEDYAFFVEGLLDLYESGFDVRWLELAARTAKDMVREFWDEKDGGFFSSAAHHEELFVRRKELYDGAIPSGNSVAFLDLLRLAEITQDPAFSLPAARMTRIAARLVKDYPHNHPHLACALEFVLSDPLEVVVVGPLDDPAARGMLDEVRRRFLPGKVLLHAASQERAEAMRPLVPLMEAKLALGGKPTAYVCRRGVCKLPARDLEALRSQLGGDPHER
jgi:hypothetical protein